MADALILDASPLIFLSRVDLLHLLPRLANTLQVPASVVAEVKAGEATDPVVAAVGTWAEGYLGRDVPVPLSVAAWELGAGESQVIPLHAVFREAKLHLMILLHADVRWRMGCTWSEPLGCY